MNKKVIVYIGIVIIIGIFASLIMYTLEKSKSDFGIESKIEQKGYNLFGKDYCTKDHSLEIAGDALTRWECKICGKTAINSNTNVPKLCENCARETKRCYQCGKLKNKKDSGGDNI